MRIHLSGDWAAPIAFSVAASAIALMSFLPGAEIVTSARIVAIVYAIAAIVFVVSALRGRKVDDDATYFSWGNIGMDVTAILFSIGLLYFGGLLIVWPFTMPIAIGPLVISLFFGIGFLSFVYLFLLKAHIVVYTPRGITTFLGRPLTLRRRHYNLSLFTSLEVRIHRTYAGTYGMISTWQRTYDIVAIWPQGKVVLGSETTEKSAKIRLEELRVLTGLPSPAFPLVEGEDTTRSVSA